MPQDRTVLKSELSSSRRKLVEMVQHLVFGRIEDLQIRNNDPVFDPPPRVIRRKKNGGTNTPRHQANAADFAIKAEWNEFFKDLDAIGNGEILSIEVSHGLPIIHEFEDVIHI